MDSKESQVKIIILLVLLAIFHIFYVRQEDDITAKLEECSFYTIMEPRIMHSSDYLYYDFYYDHKRYSSSTTLGSEDVGIGHTKESVMRERYWIQVYCNDFKTDRILWKIPVPDTLKYIPPKGWKKIPYGLKEESVWFKRWRK
ncbi:hypothetical protein [Leadbetterella sp. DM7]|uniref:hypothetical protein n=1 Tax=Leadbetterella sp. DM7 TaxID=3235085 RepID=UPI00349E5EB1